MKFLFGVSFLAGGIAGLANWTAKSSSPSAPASSGTGWVPTPGAGTIGTPSGSSGQGAAPGLSLLLTEGWPTPFDEPLDVAGDVNTQVEGGTWTQAMAWTDYDMAVSAGGWQSWDSYVQQLSEYGVDYSGFSAPPGGNTPPGGTTSNSAGSGASNPGWVPIDPGLLP